MTFQAARAPCRPPTSSSDPPFFPGAKRLKPDRGADYVNAVRNLPDVPWPQSSTEKQTCESADAGREIRRIRAEARPNIKGGLRALNRTFELPGKNPLKDVHAALDVDVLAAYDFSPKNDLLKQLLDLNLEVAHRINNEDAVTAPGIPTTYGNPHDCIRT